MANEMIRELLKLHNVKQWELADLLKIREENLSRLLRYELSEDRKKEIISLIEKASKSKSEKG